MYSSLILTTGISTLSPRNVVGKRLREEGSPVEFPPSQQNPEKVDQNAGTDQIIEDCREWTQDLDPKSTDPSLISAEFSVLYALREQAKKIHDGTIVHLIHTPTLGGRLAVVLQQRFLENRLKVQVHTEELSVPFDPNQRGGLTLASGAFIGQVSRLLAQYTPTTAAFAPIGGYKSMVALGYAAASFQGYPSLYLHEDGQVLQQIAPIPATILPSVREQVAPVARQIGNGAEWNQLTPEIQKMVTENPNFFTHVGELIELNELGQFLRLNEIPIRLSPDAFAACEKNSDIVRAQLLKLRDQAASDPDSPSINHVFVSNKGLTQPWRIAQMGRGIRHAWQLTADGLLIGKTWLKHDDYEHEAPTFVSSALPTALNQWQILSIR